MAPELAVALAGLGAADFGAPEVCASSVKTSAGANARHVAAKILVVIVGAISSLSGRLSYQRRPVCKEYCTENRALKRQAKLQDSKGLLSIPFHGWDSRIIASDTVTRLGGVLKKATWPRIETDGHG